MLKILIVEDDKDKLRKIIQALTVLEGINFDDISYANTSHEARILLKGSHFDLLILDIAIPNRADQDINKEGGLLLLEEIKERGIYNLPPHIVGITGYEEIYEIASEKFSQYLKIMILYDPSSDDWSNKLQSGVKLIISSKLGLNPTADNYQSTLAIVCALEDPELSSIRNIPWNWNEIKISGDATRYFKGDFKRNEKTQIIYAAAAARMGMTASAILATKMALLFKPEYIAMTGITAGVFGKVTHGDIIVADASWDWGAGKWTVDKIGDLRFQPEPYYIPLSVDLKNKFLKMKDDAAAFSNIRERCPSKKPDTVLSLKIGPVASGAAVLADGNTIQQILSNNRKLLGVEMEAYAIFAAASESVIPRPTPFSLKSVVDFADGNKDDQFQDYAAYTSAQTLRLFMENYI